MSIILSNGVEATAKEHGNIVIKTNDGKEIHFRPQVAVALALWIIQNVNDAFYDVNEKRY